MLACPKCKKGCTPQNPCTCVADEKLSILTAVLSWMNEKGYEVTGRCVLAELIEGIGIKNGYLLLYPNGSIEIYKGIRMVPDGPTSYDEVGKLHISDPRVFNKLDSWFMDQWI